MDRHEEQNESARQPRLESEERSLERSSLIIVPRRPRRRDILFILLAAIVIVTAAFAAACSDNADAPPATDDGRPTQSSDDRQPGSLNVPPVAGRLQPTAEEWNAILPLLEQAAAAPKDKNAQRQLALAYYNLGHFQKAVTTYERLLASKEDAVLRNRLGNTLRDMGDTDGADKAYRKAIVDDPTLAPPYLNLAELLWRQARDAEALTVLDQGLQAVPKKARPPLQTARDFIKNERQQDER